MVLLREELGMRPTDMRRVIRKAPEVLAPRPDGSTAAEAVEVGSTDRCLCVTFNCTWNIFVCAVSRVCGTPRTAL